MGQGVLLDARMEVSLPETAGPVAVRLGLSVRPESGAQELPFTLLTPGVARVEGLEMGGSLLPKRKLRDHYWDGAIPLGGNSTLELHYTVEGAWEEDGRITLPVPAPGWIPLDPHPGTFVATVTVPSGLAVTGSFPTSVTRRPSGLEGGEYEMSLQGVPSMLVLRVVRDEIPFLTLERFLDVLVVLLLLFMGFLGLRHLRRTEA